MRNTRMRRLLLALVLCIASSVSVADVCYPPPPLPKSEEYHLIFYGSVAEVEQPSNVARFKVQRVFKGGTGRDEVLIALPKGVYLCVCNMPIKKGETHMVFASSHLDKSGQVVFDAGDCAMQDYRRSPYEFQPYLDAYALEVDRAREGIRQNPQSVKAWKRLAEIQAANNDYLGALESLGKLRILASSDADVLAQMGKMLLKLWRKEDALVMFSDALKLDAGCEAAKEGRDQVLLELERMSSPGFAKLNLSSGNFSSKSLAGADFQRARMQRVKFDSSELTGANFAGADMHACSFRNAKATGASFSRANMSNGDFTAARLESADFQKAKVNSAIFAHADLRAANFADAEIRDADFSDALFDKATVWPKGFDPVKAGARMKGN